MQYIRQRTLGQKVADTYFSLTSARSISLLSLVFILIALPVTMVLLNQKTQYQQHAAGQTGHMYYVSKNGNNSDGTSWVSSWSELAQINWSVVQPGDTIVLDGGTVNMTYTTTLAIGKSGVPGSPITIQKATEIGHNGQVVLFGGRTTPLPYCGQPTYTNQTSGVITSGIAVGGHSWIVIDGMNWDGISIHSFSSNGIALESDYSGYACYAGWSSACPSSNDTFRNLELYDNGTALQQSDGTWVPHDSGDGVAAEGTNHTFFQMDIHDNADDNFEPGPVNNMSIIRSWLHETREDPNKPGLAWDRCVHNDGFQIWATGTSTGVTIQDSALGPGLMQGTILGQTRPAGGNNAIVNNVTLSNDLILDTSGNNIMGYPGIASQSWIIKNVTSYIIAPNPDGNQPNNVYLEGSGHNISNSIFYGGNINLPNGTTGSGNCQYKTVGATSLINGQTVNPQFTTDVSGFTASTPLATLANTNFALQSTSPCVGAGSSIGSISQFLSMVNPPSPTPTPTLPPSPTPTPTPQPSQTTLAPTASPTPQPVTPLSFYSIYEDALANGWQNRSWNSTVNFANTTPVYTGKYSISFAPGGYGGLNFYSGNAIDTTSYQYIHFVLQASQPGQVIRLILYDANNNQISTQLDLANYGGNPPAGIWQEYNIPLSAFQNPTSKITGFAIQNRLSSSQAPMYVASVRLLSSPVYIIYNDNLSNGWQNTSWNSSVNLVNKSPVYKGINSIAFVPNSYGGLQLSTNNSVNTNAYAYLHFALQATQPGQVYRIILYDTNSNMLPNQVDLPNYGNPPVGQWQEYNIPLSVFQNASGGIRGFAIQNRYDTSQPPLYVDDVKLTGF